MPAIEYIARRPESTQALPPPRAPYSEATNPYAALSSPKISSSRPTAAISYPFPSIGGGGRLVLGRALRRQRVRLAHERRRVGGAPMNRHQHGSALGEGVGDLARVADRNR